MSVTVTGIQPQQQPQLQQRGIMRQRTVTVTPTAPTTAAATGGVALAPSSSGKAAAPSSSPKQPKQASLLLQMPLQRSTTTMSPGSGSGGGLGGGGGGGGLMRQSTFHKAAVAKKANPSHPPGESVLNSVPIEKLRTLAGSQLEMVSQHTVAEQHCAEGRANTDCVLERDRDEQAACLLTSFLVFLVLSCPCLVRVFFLPRFGPSTTSTATACWTAKSWLCWRTTASRAR
jgi:hypothetical protein